MGSILPKGLSKKPDRYTVAKLIDAGVKQLFPGATWRYGQKRRGRMEVEIVPPEQKSVDTQEPTQ